MQEIAVDDRHEGQGAGIADRHLVEDFLGGRQQRGNLHLGEAVGLEGRQAEVLQHLVGDPLGAVLVVDRGGRGTLGDRMGEQAVGLRDGQHGRDDPRSGGLAEQRHAGRVTAERGDVVPDPAQRRQDVT